MTPHHPTNTLFAGARRHIAAAMLVTLCTACGCSSPAPQREGDYRTIATDPRRDADAAQRENARAAGLIEAERYDEAEQALKSALAADVMHGPAHNNLGMVYFHQKKLYLAAWEFQYAVKLMPHACEPRNNLGMVFETANKLDDAVESYEQARALQPDNPEPVANAARALIKRGDRDAHVRDLLAQVVLKDTRGEWVQWAKEKLATLPRTAEPDRAAP